MEWREITVNEVARYGARAMMNETRGDGLLFSNAYARLDPLSTEYMCQIDGELHKGSPSVQANAINRAMRNLGMIPEAE